MVQHLSVSPDERRHEKRPDRPRSKFFTFVVTINAIGVLLAGLDGAYGPRNCALN